HQGVQKTVRDLNNLYRSTGALHARDCEAEGFQWIVADDANNSVLAWLRFGEFGDSPVAVISNLTPVARPGYRIGLPMGGSWSEIFNSDSADYGGSGLGNLGHVIATDEPAHGFSHSADITLPPMATIMLRQGG
ncbi:MAG: glgB, partial [Caulobacteraceae bacterium]|nr:glgB [Caulobacteraceae bacterium]